MRRKHEAALGLEKLVQGESWKCWLPGGEDNSCGESKGKTKHLAIKCPFWSLALGRIPGWSAEGIKVSN